MNADPVLLPPVAAGTDGERRKRDSERAEQQFATEEFDTTVKKRELVSHTQDDGSRGDEEEGGGGESTAGSAYNPEKSLSCEYEVCQQGFLTDDRKLKRLTDPKGAFF